MSSVPDFSKVGITMNIPEFHVFVINARARGIIPSPADGPSKKSLPVYTSHGLV
jgi:hypothetical protein